MQSSLMHVRRGSRSRWATVVAGCVLAFMGSATGSVSAFQNTKHPVFVGAKECAKCHQGAGFGYQQCLMLLMPHSRAFASLAKPEAKEIARLSGIPEEPQKSPVCLGCHATGSEAEEWEREEALHLEDGVQCEKCHGAGSEYMDEEIMTKPEAARAAGLFIPQKTDCMNCHKVKGSHVAVLPVKKFDIDEAWERLKHPSPEKWDLMGDPVYPPVADAKAPQYIGSIQCGKCHEASAMGYQYSYWRLSAHADAYAKLGTPRALELAKEAGVTGDPLTEPACLKCHTTVHHAPAGGQRDSYALDEGVGCEACHGAGSQFAEEAIMRDEPAALQAGLKPVSRDTCLPCHEQAHGKPFDYDEAAKKIAHPLHREVSTTTVTYKNPLRLALHPQRPELYVTCEMGNTVIVVDTSRWEKVAEIRAGGHPTGITFHPSGQRAYVTNRLDDTVSVVDTVRREIVATLPVGDEPHGVRTDATGKQLFVLNTSTDDISVIDTESLREIKRLEASRGPWSMALSGDGQQFAVTNTLPRFVPFRTPSVAEVTLVDAKQGTVQQRVEVPGANLLMGVCWHPSGKFALCTMNRTNNLVPMTRLLQGWTITNGLAIIWRDGRVDQVLLDEPNLCFPDPTDVAITPDGRLALVTSSGTNRVAVVDLSKLISMLEQASDQERAEVFPNHLGKPTEFIIKHIATELSPRGIVITPDGKQAVVTNWLDDSLTVIDMTSLEAVKRVDLGGPTEVTKTRYGERLFHSANIAFHRQFSCHTCHPDGHVDGLTYDIQSDGIGVGPVDNRTLRGILDTSPFKWAGTNPSLSRQCGARLAVFFSKIQPFTPDELSAIDNYICTIPRPENRYRPLGAELTDAQRRGKAVFERTRTNDGREIPREKRCVTCHFPPLYTDRNVHVVGTQMHLDPEKGFDVPHLNNVYDSAPYLHNGIAETLEEIWTRYNPRDEHGMTNDMTKDQLNDLIEYLMTL
ncbi:MAG: multiheme c-type cytochrome [Pirellulaceae bacterium]